MSFDRKVGVFFWEHMTRGPNLSFEVREDLLVNLNFKMKHKKLW